MPKERKWCNGGEEISSRMAIYFAALDRLSLYHFEVAVATLPICILLAR